MENGTRVIVRFILVVSGVVILSLISSTLWGGKPEGIPETRALVITEGMTIEEFGKENHVPRPVLRQHDYDGVLGEILDDGYHWDCLRGIIIFPTRSTHPTCSPTPIGVAARHRTGDLARRQITCIALSSGEPTQRKIQVDNLPGEIQLYMQPKRDISV